MGGVDRQQGTRLLERLFDAVVASATREELAARAADEMVAAMGGGCAVWLMELHTGKLGLAAVRHADPEMVPLIARALRRLPSTRGDGAVARALRTDRMVSATIGDQREARELLGSRDRAGSARRAGLRGITVAPLVLEGRRLGLLALLSTDPDSGPEQAVDELAAQAAGHLSRAVVLLDRISMAHLASQQLALTSLRIQTVLESVPQGVIVAEPPDGRISVANGAVLRLLGREIDPLAPVDRYPEMLGLTHPTGEMYRMEEIPWVRSLRTRRPVAPVEMAVHRPDGSVVTILCSASPIINGGDLVGGSVAVLQDISERKELELQKEEFLAMVAHELRTPLTSIKGYVQLLLARFRKEGEPRIDPWAVGALETADRQADRLAGLVDDLLDLSRIQMGRLELKRSRFPLGELATSVVGRMRSATAEHRLEMTSDGDTRVYADLRRIDQVFVSLLSNAFKATPRGGAIGVAVGRRGDAVVASVRDDGIGMTSAVQSRIFERLYRGPESSHAGMGLGLYISKQIVDAHGGRIWFESQQGKGSIFHFSLPAAE